MENLDIGDVVLAGGCNYKITGLPGCCVSFKDYYEGVDQAIGLRGLFRGDEVVKVISKAINAAPYKPFKMEYEGHEVEILATSDNPYSQAAIRFPDGRLAVFCKDWLKPIKTERDKWIDDAEMAMCSLSPELDRIQLGMIYDKMIANK